MKEIIKNIYDFLGNKLYFKLLYLFVSLTFVTILKDIPKITILNYAAFAWGALLILFMIIDGYKRRKVYKFDIPLAIFIIVTLFLNIIVYRSSHNLTLWAVNLILFTVVFSVDVFRDKRQLIKELNYISYFYVGFMFLASIFSLILRFSGKTIEVGQVVFGTTKGVFENENALSIAAALAIVICIYLNNIAKIHRLKMFWLANIVMQAVTMVGSHGRSAYLIVVAVIYAFIFISNKNKYFRAILLIIPVIACGVFFELDKSNIRDFTSGRSSLWTSASIVIDEHPFTGVGNSNLVEAVKSARETDDLPGLETGGLHNMYVQTATVNGLVQLVFFLTFILMILAFIIEHLDKLHRKEKLQMTTITSLIVGILAVNLFESALIYSVSFISMIFWIYLGYLVSILDNKNIE